MIVYDSYHNLLLSTKLWNNLWQFPDHLYGMNKKYQNGGFQNIRVNHPKLVMQDFATVHSPSSPD